MLALINRERAAARLPALAPNEELRRAARAHALEMVRYAYLSHQSRDGPGPEDRRSNGSLRLALGFAGENVGYGADIYATHRAFMASPVHRRTILTGVARTVGIGVVAIEPNGVIVVEDFGH